MGKKQTLLGLLALSFGLASTTSVPVVTLAVDRTAIQQELKSTNAMIGQKQAEITKDKAIIRKWKKYKKKKKVRRSKKKTKKAKRKIKKWQKEKNNDTLYLNHYRSIVPLIGARLSVSRYRNPPYLEFCQKTPSITMGGDEWLFSEVLSVRTKKVF